MAAVGVAGVAAQSALASSGDQSTAYQADAAHDGYIADAGLAAPLTQAWSVALPCCAVSYPLIVNGMVFVTDANDTLYALNQATGSTLWSQGIGGTNGWSGLTYDRGQVFVLNNLGQLTAFDPATGSIAWSEQLPGAAYLFSSAPTATDGIVYVSGSGGGTVYAVRESDGHLLWTQPVIAGDDSSPAVNTQGVYVTYALQWDYAFDPLSGSPLWLHRPISGSGGGGATPVLAGGYLFARDVSSGNLVLSASTGAVEGAFNAGPAPAVANNVAFMLNRSTLTAVAGTGLGSDDWTFTGDGNLDTAPLAVGGLVFVGSSMGNLYALDAATGATSWSTNVGIPITAPDFAGLAAANGTLVFPAGNGQLVAYRSAGAITSAPSNQSPPTIAGSPEVNQIQAADVGVWSGLPNSYTYQWEQCDAAGANCADIPGATGTSFTPPVGVLGSTLRVKVVATNGVGSSAPVESAFVEFPKPTAVSLSPAQQSIPVDAGANLTAQVTGTSTGTVELDATPNGGNRTLVASGAVGSGGRVSFTVSPTVTTTYTAVLEAGPGYTSSTSQDVTVNIVPRNTLTITKSGAGSGTVTSSPPGITCGTVCSHAFTKGTAVTLTGVAAAGSTFAGWSGGCLGTSSCEVTMVTERSVTATFKVSGGPHCVVPTLKGEPLRAAKRAIRAHNCTVGKIRDAASPTVMKGRVISQRPKPGSRLKHGARVDLVVGEGRR